MVHSQKKKNLIDIIPEETLKLLVKDIKLNTFNELKEITDKELIGIRKTMYEQTIKSRSYIKEPHRNSGAEKYNR